MAKNTTVKKNKFQNKKNRSNKVNLVFDEAKRREFLTGFRKRKQQRKKEARAKLERDLKEERKRLKSEAKESYKKLVVSHRPIPELESLLKEEYEDDNATVKIVELSTNDMAKQNNWIGANQPICEESEPDIEENENEEVPGMELKEKKITNKGVKRKFESEREVKRLLKKEATSKVKKSKVFQMKNKIEKQKQKKKSRQLKKQRIKLKERKLKKRH